MDIQNDKFNELCKALGSNYAAVAYITKLARKKMSSRNYQMLESEAISWVLTGVEPKVRKKIDIRAHFEYNIVEDILCLVDDVAVCKLVRKSYGESLKRHHLIYCYHSTLDKGRRSRVRILTRMIWYNITQEGGYTYGE